ncbi:MAG: hypothetical protein H3C71_00325 [Flavobacteriales bacterium]|nr:hypothetical protein [Flavobacteriales bacterium]
MKKLLFIPVLLGLVMYSCSKNDDPIPAEQYAGLGDNGGTPLVTTVNVPSNIQIVSAYYGGNPEYRQAAPNFNKRDLGQSLTADKSIDADWTPYGTGTYVTIFVKMLSADGFPHTWDIPGGTIFCDTTGNYQHGFIIQDIHVQIGGTDTTFAYFNAYCLNLSRSSSDKDAHYILYGKTQNTPLLEVVQLVTGKDLSSATGVLQSIIWNITESNGVLTDDDRDQLNAL